jgi:hypothetical protein
MNSAPNQSENNTFNSQPATGTQGNPFTADLKGEFTSNFGTNTNAVSQIFKDGSFGNSNRNRYILAGVGVIALLLIGWLLLSGDGEEGADVAEDDILMEETPAEEVGADETASAPIAEAPPAEVPAAVPEVAEAPMPMASGSISLSAPENGASLAYDETQGAAMFSWSGGPGTVVFSRNSSMQPEVMRVKVSSSSYAFHHPWPGQWFWKVDSEGGSSEVRSFSVSAPIRRNIALSEPASGASLAGSGGVVSWVGDKGVAYYRVELSQSDDWANPQFKFSSSGSQVQLNGVTPGQYQLRLGAFSEVSGRWEFTQPVAVTVQ